MALTDPPRPAPMWYRSLSFHRSQGEGPPLDADVVALGARLGFNDVTVQMGGMQGGVIERCTWLRAVWERDDYPALLATHGMSVSAWMYELNTCTLEECGPFTPSNDRLFQTIGERYRRGLGEIFPALDHVVLSVSESRFWVGQDPALLARLVETIHDACADLGKTLIIKTFVWHPDQLAGIIAAADSFPPGVVIQSKCVPQDWSPRNIDDRCIGAFPQRQQIIEVDLFGENAGMHFVANCRLTELKRQFDHWQAHGACGISARVARRMGHDRNDPEQTWYDSVLGNAQEANMWFLGAAASGSSTDPEVAVRRFTADRFGDELAEPLAQILRHTGEVINEAQCVDRFTFGRSLPLRGITNGYPAIPGQHGSTYLTPEGERLSSSEIRARHGGNLHAHLRVAERYDDADDLINRNPFHLNWAAHRWDPAYIPLYQRLRRGDPEIIRAKTEGYQRWLTHTESSLVALADLQERMPAGGYAFLRWKLEENRYYLIIRSELALAWLKAERRLYTTSDPERDTLVGEIGQHLATMVAEHQAHAHETYAGTWLGRERYFIRGAYFNTVACVAEFKRFWQHTFAPGRPPWVLAHDDGAALATSP